MNLNTCDLFCLIFRLRFHCLRYFLYTLGKAGESMERLDVPTKFLTLVKPGTKLPLEWSEEMSESLRESVEGDYKRIMAEHFTKEFHN